MFLGSPTAGLAESLILGTVLGEPLLNLKSVKGQYSRESTHILMFGKSVLSIETLIVFYIFQSCWDISLAGQPGENCPNWCGLIGHKDRVGKNPGFFFKPSPVGFFGFFAQKRGFLGFFQFREYF